MTVVSLGVFAWLVAAVAACWATPLRWSHLVLAALTLAFLAIYDPLSAALLSAFALLTFFVPRLVAAPAGAAAIGVGGVIVGVLLFFKAGGAGEFDDIVRRVLIPLGLSYYSFRCLHYLIERYKGTLPAHNFGDFIGYLFFLPTLIAGPIHRFNHYQRDLRRRRWNAQMFSEGLERILYGYVQIVVLGNWLVSAKLVPLVEGIGPDRTALREYLEAVCFGLNLYFQFAGYSSVAIGFGLLLGFRVIENFDRPFLRRNISEFWRCWHISLSSWCRDYIYMPVVSNTRRVALGALMSMVVIGLWHELSGRYLCWGLYHGAGIIVWQAFQRAKAHLPAVESAWARHLAAALSLVLTFNFVMLSFVITKEPTLADAGASFAAIFLAWR